MKTAPRNSPERDKALKAFEAIGLHSKSMSRKNASETRRADSLKMIFRDDARKHQRISEAEVFVQFHENHVTTTFILNAFLPQACISRGIDRQTYEESYDDYHPERVAAYVKQAIAPFLS